MDPATEAIKQLETSLILAMMPIFVISSLITTFLVVHRTKLVSDVKHTSRSKWLVVIVLLTISGLAFNVLLTYWRLIGLSDELVSLSFIGTPPIISFSQGFLQWAIIRLTLKPKELPDTPANRSNKFAVTVASLMLPVAFLVILIADSDDSRYFPWIIGFGSVLPILLITWYTMRQNK